MKTNIDKPKNAVLELDSEPTASERLRRFFGAVAASAVVVCTVVGAGVVAKNCYELHNIETPVDLGEIVGGSQ